MPSPKKPGDILSFSSFRFDNRGILGLPLKVVVTLIIGATAMGLVVGYVMTNAPESDTLEVSTNTRSIDEGLGQEITFTVRDGNGNPVKDATVTCTGCGDAIAGKTNKDGRLTLEFDPLLSSEHRSEEYLDVKVRAGGFNTYQKEQMVQVTEADYSGFLDAAEEYADEIVKAEGEELENYKLIEEFPASIEGTVNQQGTEEKADIYVIDPELANQIPDNFYISFLGDGLTSFRISYVELYGDTSFPNEESLDKTNWKDSQPHEGFIDWIPKELQGCNSVEKTRLKHNSPRTVMIIVERYEDLFGSGDYTLRLDNKKHYSEFYNAYRVYETLIETSFHAMEYLNDYLRENLTEIISYLANPAVPDHEKIELFSNVINDCPFKNVVNSITHEGVKAADNLRNIIDDFNDFVENHPECNVLLDIAGGTAVTIDNIVEGIVNTFHFDFIIEFLPAEKFETGIKFGYDTGITSPTKLNYRVIGTLFLDFIMLPSPLSPLITIPVPGFVSNFTLDFINPLNQRETNITSYHNWNPFSNSDRNWDLFVGAHLGKSTASGVHVELGGRLGLYMSVGDKLIKNTLLGILDTAKDFKEIEDGNDITYQLILPASDKTDFEMILEGINRTSEILGLLCNNIAASTAKDIEAGIQIAVGGGVGVDIPVPGAIEIIDGTIAGEIKGAISASIYDWGQLYLLDLQLRYNLFRIQLGESILYACECVSDKVDQDSLNIAKDFASDLINNSIEELQNIDFSHYKNMLYDHFYFGAGLSLALNIGVLEGVVEATPVEATGMVKMSLRHWIYHIHERTGLLNELPFSIDSIKKIKEIINLDLASSISAGTPIVGIKGSYSTSKTMMRITYEEEIPSGGAGGGGGGFG